MFQKAIKKDNHGEQIYTNTPLMNPNMNDNSTPIFTPLIPKREVHKNKVSLLKYVKNEENKNPLRMKTECSKINENQINVSAQSFESSPKQKVSLNLDSVEDIPNEYNEKTKINIEEKKLKDNFLESNPIPKQMPKINIIPASFKINTKLDMLKNLKIIPKEDIKEENSHENKEINNKNLLNSNYKPKRIESFNKNEDIFLTPQESPLSEFFPKKSIFIPTSSNVINPIKKGLS